MTAPTDNVAPKSQANGFFRRFLRKPLAIAGLAWVVIALGAGLLSHQIAPYDPLTQDLLLINQGPSATHWLGTDTLGRDVLSRLMAGAVPTLLNALIAVVIAVVVGVTIGLIAGYAGGRTDRFTLQVVDLVIALPSIVILFTALTVFNRNMAVAMALLGLIGSAGIIRIIRSAAISVRAELYVDAAKISGLSSGLIVVRHILPRVVGPIIVQLSLFAGIALLSQTGLSFLGLGTQQPAATWGGMIQEASTVLGINPSLLAASGGVVALTILAFGVIGDSARDAAAEGWSSPRGAKKRTAHTLPPTFGPVDPEAVLDVQGLTINAHTDDGDLVLVDNVSLTLLRGEVLGVVGESGCGKTISALSILGLLPHGVDAVSGQLTVDGQSYDMADAKSLRKIRGKKVGMIFQEPAAALDPCFTIEDQIIEVIQLHDRMSRRDAKKRVIELLEQVQILNPQDVAKRYMHQISGGMAQRVGIARALAARPDILLADEPTTALDVTVQAEVLDLIRRLGDEFGMSVIIVTHDWGVVADICDRAAVLYAGAVVETATLTDIFTEQRHPYTADLLRANPHNAATGEKLPTIPGSVPKVRDWTAGCVYAPRCALATEACKKGSIPLEVVGDRHQARCVRNDVVALEEHVS